MMRNLRDTIFYMKMNVLQGFHFCISVPLRISYLSSEYSSTYMKYIKRKDLKERS